VLGWSSDPDGEALLLLHFGPRCPRSVWVLGWSSDSDSEALFLLHFGPHITIRLGPPYPFANAPRHCETSEGSTFRELLASDIPGTRGERFHRLLRRLVARNGHADRIERCPVLGVERKTSARREYFRF
jgi:hypothetical protein